MSEVDRVMVFIDARNIMIPALENGLKVDWIKLRNVLSNGRKVVRTYFFEGEPKDMSEKQSKFHTFLRSNGFMVITRPLKIKTIRCDHCILGKKLEKKGVSLPNVSVNTDNQIQIPYQKGVDVALATELLRMARENVFDIAIIASGDNDFANAAECASSWGKTIEIASFQKVLGEDIKSKAQKLWILDMYLKQITLQK